MSTTSPTGILACSTVLPVLGAVVTSLRLHTRFRQKTGLKFDDWAQIPALLLFIGMAVSGIVGVSRKAFGYPTPPGPINLTASSTILCEKLWFAIQIMQIFALGLIKTAALSFYRRIFCPHKSSVLNSTIWVLICLTVTWTVACIIAYVSACGSHPAAAWGGNIPYVLYCGKQTLPFEEAYAISDFILDVCVLLVPLPSIWSLQMSIGRKVAVTGVFMLALVGFGASIARLVKFVQLASGAMGKSATDIQTLDTQAVWFSMLETGLALIALNLPPTWSLISRLSIDSVLQSLRSLLSLRSRGSNGLSSGQSTKARDHAYTNMRNGSNAASQNIELVPNGYLAKFDNKFESQGTIHPRMATDDIEEGINVERSMEQTESRLV